MLHRSPGEARMSRAGWLQHRLALPPWLGSWLSPGGGGRGKRRSHCWEHSQALEVTWRCRQRAFSRTQLSCPQLQRLCGLWALPSLPVMGTLKLPWVKLTFLLLRPHPCWPGYSDLAEENCPPWPSLRPKCPCLLGSCSWRPPHDRLHRRSEKSLRLSSFHVSSLYYSGPWQQPWLTRSSFYQRLSGCQMPCWGLHQHLIVFPQEVCLDVSTVMLLCNTVTLPAWTK